MRSLKRHVTSLSILVKEYASSHDCKDCLPLNQCKLSLTSCEPKYFFTDSATLKAMLLVAVETLDCRSEAAFKGW